jgi:hypothetical protein
MCLLDQVLCLDGPLLSLTGFASGVEDALLQPLGTVHDPTPCQEGRTAYFPPALHDAGQEDDD